MSAKPTFRIEPSFAGQTIYFGKEEVLSSVETITPLAYELAQRAFLMGQVSGAESRARRLQPSKLSRRAAKV